LHVLKADNLVRTFAVTAENESLVTTVLADEEMFVFGTDAGNVIAGAADSPTRLWEFKANEGLAGPLIRDGRSFYFASKDTHIYRIDMTDRGSINLTWRYQSEAILDRPPRVTANAVYQHAPGRGLNAIGKQAGTTLWALRDGLDLLAEVANTAYVITETGAIAVMDNRTGQSLHRFAAPDVAYHAANTFDDKIYIIDKQGHVACLRPIP
jgi:outer membrane protein assembly factor BamB